MPLHHPHVQHPALPLPRRREVRNPAPVGGDARLRPAWVPEEHRERDGLVALPADERPQILAAHALALERRVPLPEDLERAAAQARAAFLEL